MTSGYGPVPRKEDARFIRGKGTFVDDIQLPGMLYGAVLRSPLAHARIRSVDVAAAPAAEFAAADVVIAQDMLYPRSHPAPLETCGIVADLDRISGKLTLWSTSQAPHAHRTMYALIAGVPEHKIRVVSPDIGGGFG